MKELNELFDWLVDLEESDCDCFYDSYDAKKNLYKIEEYVANLEHELNLKSYPSYIEQHLTKDMVDKFIRNLTKEKAEQFLLDCGIVERDIYSNLVLAEKFDH
jgi:hypothetical protein